MLTRIRATKNLDLPRYDAARSVEGAAERTRARFATPGKHTIYDKKLQEAQRYLAAVADGKTPADLKKYPYMERETGPGKTAETPVELANLWVSMNAAWEQVSPLIEDISITAKARIRAAGSTGDIRDITEAALSALDEIGEKPPPRPPGKSRLDRP
jgi:hypothetical protein